MRQMKQIHVSDEKRFMLSAHLEAGSRLEIGQTSEKMAWIRKARSQVLMLDPVVEKATGGLLRRAYSDLGRDLQAIEAETDFMAYAPKVEERFRSALGSIEVVRDCILIAPEAILSESGAVNPYFFDLPEMAGWNGAFVVMPFTEPWSDRIWSRHLKPIVQGIQIAPQLICKRADDLYGHDVLLDIVAAIPTPLSTHCLQRQLRRLFRIGTRAQGGYLRNHCLMEASRSAFHHRRGERSR